MKKPTRTKVLVTVVDGDTHRRLEGARVRQDHLQRRARRPDALHRQLLRPADRPFGRVREGQIHPFDERPDLRHARVAGGRVFVPSSTDGSLTAFTTAGRYPWRVNTGSYDDGKYTPVVADRERLYLVGLARVYGMVER